MSWLDRQSFLGPNSNEVLGALTVGIVGLGGGGSHVAQQLAHVGVGGFIVVDPDSITDTNLNRLVGGARADVAANAPKVDIAERVIKAVNPAARVIKRCCVWQAADDALKQCDIVIAGLDNVRAKHELDAFTRRFMIPLIDMGMDVHAVGGGSYLVAGQVILTGPGEPCLQCLGIVTAAGLTEEAANYGSVGGNPQVVWPNGVLASTAVGLFMQLVVPWNRRPITSAFLEYDGNRHTIAEADVLRRRAGTRCPHYSTKDVGDPMFDIRKLAAAPVRPPEQPPVLKQPWWRRLLSQVRPRARQVDGSDVVG